MSGGDGGVCNGGEVSHVEDDFGGACFPGIVWVGRDIGGVRASRSCSFFAEFAHHVAVYGDDSSRAG